MGKSNSNMYFLGWIVCF